jgi:hypothetical protein
MSGSCRPRAPPSIGEEAGERALPLSDPEWETLARETMARSIGEAPDVEGEMSGMWWQPATADAAASAGRFIGEIASRLGLLRCGLAPCNGGEAIVDDAPIIPATVSNELEFLRLAEAVAAGDACAAPGKGGEAAAGDVTGSSIVGIWRLAHAAIKGDDTGVSDLPRVRLLTTSGRLEDGLQVGDDAPLFSESAAGRKSGDFWTPSIGLDAGEACESDDMRVLSCWESDAVIGESIPLSSNPLSLFIFCLSAQVMLSMSMSGAPHRLALLLLSSFPSTAELLPRIFCSLPGVGDSSLPGRDHENVRARVRASAIHSACVARDKSHRRLCRLERAPTAGPRSLS